MFNKKNKNKGQVLVLVALFILFVGLPMLALAIDVAYFYHAKHQLQGAADAAALAGAAKLDGTNNTAQVAARAEALKYAGLNKAAGNDVVILGPAGVNNFSSDNDIEVGKWNGTSFSNISTPINAVKARARRTGTSSPYGLSPGGPVNTFFGKIFGIDTVNIKTEAIATMNKGNLGPFPLCVAACGSITSLNIESSEQNLTPGTRFYVKPQDGSPNIAWTSFLDNSTNGPTISGYILGNTVAPPVCGLCIHTTQGTVNPAFCDLRKMIRQKRADYVIKGKTIRGWRVAVPVLDNTFICPGGHLGCVTDPGNQPGDPFKVSNYAEIIMTDAVPQGNCPGDPEPIPNGKPGIVVVGTGTGGNSNQSSISCIDCTLPEAQTILGNTKPKLVQ